MTMTHEQIKQWNDYACVARCLLKLSDTNGNPVTRDEFCFRFEQLFPNPTTRYGQLDAPSFFAVLKSLSLPIHVTESDDYSVVESEFNGNKRGVLLISHIDLNPGHTNVINHCSVLTKIDAATFSIWTPCQTGADAPMNLTKADWTAKQCSGLILS